MSTVPIYSVRDIREIEKSCPGEPLMERAGCAAAEEAASLIASRNGPVLVLCGPGNNGGDGFVLARELHRAGRDTAVVFAGDSAHLPEDAAHAHASFLHAGGKTLAALPPAPPGGWALVVDAAFGIGLHKPIEGRVKDWIESINALPCLRLSIDVPSGLDADTGKVSGPCVRATHTITFIALKPGLLTLDGPEHCGEISLQTIGTDSVSLIPPMGHRVDTSLWATHLTSRSRNAHKGLYGDACVVGGATGMVGAALLAARAALCLGAGRVYARLLDPNAPSVDLVWPELMLRPAKSAVHASALAIGPGLGTGAEATNLVEEALSQNVPLLLDADALNLVSLHPRLAQALRQRQATTLLTPHPAEAGRLLGMDTGAIQSDRVHAAVSLAREFRALAVLKGCGSVVATPDGRWFINTTGNPGMASAGMGDVLSGLLLSLLAQGWPAEAALLCAVHLHGAAADLLVANGTGPVGLTAGETITAARKLFNQWLSGHRKEGVTSGTHIPDNFFGKCEI